MVALKVSRGYIGECPSAKEISKFTIDVESLSARGVKFDKKISMFNEEDTPQKDASKGDGDLYKFDR